MMMPKLAPLCVLLVLTLSTVEARNNTKLGRLPPLGWNTWCTWSSCHQDNSSLSHAFHDVCTESMVKDVAQAIIDQGLQKAGYRWINLDDWYVGMNPVFTRSFFCRPLQKQLGSHRKGSGNWCNAGRSCSVPIRHAERTC